MGKSISINIALIPIKFWLKRKIIPFANKWSTIEGNEVSKYA